MKSPTSEDYRTLVIEDITSTIEQGLRETDVLPISSLAEALAKQVFQVMSGMDLSVLDTALGIGTGNPDFDMLIDNIRDTYASKNSDYANLERPYFTFEKVSEFLGKEVDDMFLMLICTKIARIVQLREKAATPSNESLLDSKLDLATYATIMYSYAIKQGQA